MPITRTRTIAKEALHDPVRRAQAVSNCVSRLGKGFKQVTKSNMETATHTGRLYNLSPRGAGFSRTHRASARFERPAPITHNLINSVKDEKTSDNSVEIFVDDGQAPYGKYLQSDKLEREIMTDKDALDYLETGPGKNELTKLDVELTNY